ncbi:Serine/threonine-protein phosphatase 7 long form-like [Vitis vinifera]|uniref:Serine/threonine-protein phosphatase 7 long form-like n=1 Tax=Vitis vinifera TaxID=29760 RepID=A0A438BV86_VITVI|nr:Serine/threonine-protein phosphatase 7 long form-like [Vitis vinifera]
MATRGTHYHPDHPHPDFPKSTCGALLLSGLPQGEAHNTHKYNIRTTAIAHPDDRHTLSGVKGQDEVTTSHFPRSLHTIAYHDLCQPPVERLNQESILVEIVRPSIWQLHMYTPLFPTCPDPEDTSVLTLQHRHRSSTIRVDPDMGSVLTFRHRFRQEWVLDDRVRPYIIQSRFHVFHRVGHVKVDWPLITALVERWHLETHTFHMLVDTGWHALCEELLGVRPTKTDIRGASLGVHFITTNFSHLPPWVVDKVTLQCHARA